MMAESEGAGQAKGLAEAQSQARLAKAIGEVKAGPYTGGVTAKDGAGGEEAQLLAAQAVREAARRVAMEVRELARVFYVFSAAQMPSFQRLTAYRFRVKVLREAFAALDVAAADAAEAKGVFGTRMVTVGEASAGVDAFSKLLGFFKTDYEVGGTAVTLEEAMLVNAVAGQLARAQTRVTAGAGGGSTTETLAGCEVHLPGVYHPGVGDPGVGDPGTGDPGVGVGGVMAELTALFALRRAATTKLEGLRAEAGVGSGGGGGMAGGGTVGADGGSAGGGGGATKDEADQLMAVMALFDGFVASLSTPDGSGEAPVVAVAREGAIDAALRAGGAVLLLRLESSGGGYLIKKNLLTGLGRMPMYSMGGATVSYVLLEGRSGRVLAGDVVPVYGGVVRTDRLREWLG